MERLATAVLVFVGLGITGCSQLKDNVRPDALVDQTSEGVVLGPEVFPFCGGWVEVFAQVRPLEPTRVVVKASPPAGTDWTVRNAHVVVEAGGGSSGPLRFEGVQEVHIHGGEGRVTSWPLVSVPGKVEDGLKVALVPFEGCPSGQALRGVVLRHHFENVTVSR